MDECFSSRVCERGPDLCNIEEVYLSVIGIAVEIQIEVAENLTEREDVNDEKEWAECGTWGNTMCDCGCDRGVVVKRNEV